MPATVQTFSDLSGALPAIYREPTVRTLNATSKLLRLLPIVRGSGKNVTFDVEGTGAVAEAYADGADAANYGTDALVTPVLNWGLYRSNFGATKLARDAAGSSSSPSDLADQIGRSYVNSVRKLSSYLNGLLYSGAGTGATAVISGLNVAIHNANTYAGIDRTAGGGTTYAYWQSTLVDPGALTPPTLKLLRSDLATIEDACGEKPDIAVCSTAVFQKIASLFDDSRQYVVPTMVNTARGDVQLDASISRVVLDGCTIIADKDCTANAIYYLNTNYVRVEYLPSAAATLLPEVSRDTMADDGYGEIPLGFSVEALAKTGAASKFSLYATLQLVVSKPSACGKRLNVSTT